MTWGGGACISLKSMERRTIGASEAERAAGGCGRSRSRAPLLVLGAAGTGRTEALAAGSAAWSRGAEAAGSHPLGRRGDRGSGPVPRRRSRPPTRSSSSTPIPSPPRGCCASTRPRPRSIPFFESLSPAERLAMLLDRIDELPLRRHEIRGNPAGLLARIVDRIDALKSAGVTAERFRRWAEEQAGGARPSAIRPPGSGSSPRSTSCTTRCCARRARWTTPTPCSS